MSEQSPVEQVRAILRNYGMPDRLLPDNIVDGEHDPSTGAFRVELARSVDREVEGIPVRYATTISGRIENGRIEALNGVKAKKLIWLRVDGIRAIGDKLAFLVGPITKHLPRKAFE